MHYFEESMVQPKPKNKNISKWMSLGVMQRVEQVQCIAEMLSANMEDIAEQMEDLENCINYLQEGTDTIQEEIEELTCLIESEIDFQEGIGAITTKSATDDSLPF